jgi:hypothetical protein
LAEFEAELAAYEAELREQLGQQFADYEDIDHPTTDAFNENEHPRDADGKFDTSGGGGKAWQAPSQSHGSRPPKRTLASYTDPEGYTLSVVGEVRGGPEVAMGARRYGTMLITPPSGKTVRSGYWMNFPEASWGMSEKEYRAKSWEERAALQAKHSATAYASLKEAHKSRVGDSASWVEGDHPRASSGSSIGGQFTGGSAGGSAREQKTERAGNRREAKAGKEEGKGVVGRGVRAVKAFGAEEAHAIHAQLSKIDPEHRAKLAHNIRAVAKSVPSLLKGKWKEEVQHAKHAAHGLRALATGNRPSPEQIKGLRNFAVRILMTAGSVAVGDPTGSVGHLAAAFGQEAVQHVVVEHALKTMVGGGMVAARKAFGPSRDAEPNGADEELSDEDLKLLQQFAEAIAKAIENFDPDDYEDIDHPDDIRSNSQ